MPQVLSVSRQQGSTTVYTARGPDGQKVAVKALSLQSMASWDELEAFERESRALRALSHGNAAIPAFVEVFEEDNMDRTFYLVQVSCWLEHSATWLTIACSHVCSTEAVPHSTGRMQPGL